MHAERDPGVRGPVDGRLEELGDGRERLRVRERVRLCVLSHHVRERHSREALIRAHHPPVLPPHRQPRQHRRHAPRAQLLRGHGGAREVVHRAHNALELEGIPGLEALDEDGHEVRVLRHWLHYLDAPHPRAVVDEERRRVDSNLVPPPDHRRNSVQEKLLHHEPLGRLGAGQRHLGEEERGVRARLGRVAAEERRDPSDEAVRGHELVLVELSVLGDL
mmetsp:Transcript_21664/g.52154  ORF Transcript_21664/g.52154 Transcript_21664/m.52154 type:complete len:219 (+) Transcript_21664:4038-4694(+)